MHAARIDDAVEGGETVGQHMAAWRDGEPRPIPDRVLREARHNAKLQVDGLNRAELVRGAPRSVDRFREMSAAQPNRLARAARTVRDWRLNKSLLDYVVRFREKLP